MSQKWNKQGDRIQSRHDSSKVLEVAGSSTEVGAKLCMWQWKGQVSQRWTFHSGTKSSASTSDPASIPNPYYSAPASTPSYNAQGLSGMYSAPAAPGPHSNPGPYAYSSAAPPTGPYSAPAAPGPHSNPGPYAYSSAPPPTGPFSVPPALTPAPYSIPGYYIPPPPAGPAPAPASAQAPALAQAPVPSSTEGPQTGPNSPAHDKQLARKEKRKKAEKKSQSGTQSATFYIKSCLHGKVLEVKDASTAANAAVTVWDKRDKPEGSQLWYMDEQNILHSLLNCNSLKDIGKGMGVAPYDPEGDQRWALMGEKIVNLTKPQTCVDIAKANMSNGAKVISNDYKGSANQHWQVDHI